MQYSYHDLSALVLLGSLSDICERNLFIMSHLTDFAQCRMSLYLRAWALYLDFCRPTCHDIILCNFILSQTKFVNIVTLE